MRYPKIVLASNSPRRRELLAQIISPEEFMVIGADIQEKIIQGEDGESFSIRMAEKKARAVIEKYKNSYKSISVVIGADTVILFNHEIIGQPQNTTDAIHILKRLSGHCHTVITGVAVFLLQENKVIKFTVKSKVWMHKLSDGVIKRYVNSNEPMDKAGAYAIQGMGRQLIEKIEGSYTNIIGLPLDELKQVLRKIKLFKEQIGKEFK